MTRLPRRALPREPRADAATTPRRRGGVAVLAAGTFLMGTSEFSVAGLLPQLAHTYSVSVAEAGLAITVFAVGMVIGSPTTVLLTLRLERRATLVLLLLVFALGHLIAALSGSFALLLVARVVTAFATGAFWALAGLAAADAAGAGARTRALGAVQSGARLATIVGVPIGAVLGQLASWREPFWALALLALITSVAIRLLLPRTPAPAESVRIRSQLAALRSARLWLVLLACAFVNGGVLSVYSFVSPLLTDRAGLPESTVPIALGLFGGGALIGSQVAARVGDRHPHGTIVTTATLTLVAVGGLAATSTWVVPTMVSFTLLGLVGLSSNAVLTAFVIRYAGRTPTLASALPPSAFNLGTAAGTGITAVALTGPLRESAPLLIGAVASVLALILFAVVIQVDRRGGSIVPADGAAAAGAADRRQP